MPNCILTILIRQIFCIVDVISRLICKVMSLNWLLYNWSGFSFKKIKAATKHDKTKSANFRKKVTLYFILCNFKKDSSIFNTFEEERFRKIDAYFALTNTSHAIFLLTCLYVQVFFSFLTWKLVAQGFYSKFTSRVVFDALNTPF